MANPQATPITLTTGNSITKSIIAKDATGAIGTITGLQINGIIGTGIAAVLNTAAQTVTFTSNAYGSVTFTFKAINVVGGNLFIDQTVNNPAPVIATELDIVN